jgi:hypothetical protein
MTQAHGNGSALDNRGHGGKLPWMPSRRNAAAVSWHRGPRNAP